MKKIILVTLSLLLTMGLVMANETTLPAAVKTTVLKYGTMEQVTDIEEDVDDANKPIYYITVEKGSKVIYLTIDAKGKVLEKEEEDYEEVEEMEAPSED